MLLQTKQTGTFVLLAAGLPAAILKIAFRGLTALLATSL